MKTLTLEAPAKINLTLDILGRRTDGYHDMRMVMQAVSLGDTVTVAEAAGGFSLLTEGISLPAGKVTLEQRAADAFFHRLGRPVPGLEVRLAKRVPAYAGLGGGSADVAAVLRCLRTLYAPDLPRQALEEIGLAVGSDVPFCVRGGTCLAEGRGELLTDLPPLPDCAIVLCKPDFGLPTPELFARLDGADLGPRPDTAAMAAALARGDLAAAAACLGNVFERVLTEEEGEEVPADEEEEFEVQYARLRKVVDGLPEKCREIFILGCVDGLSYKEVSEKMGVSVNTVKTQIKLAYRKLKLELGGQNFVWEWTAGGVLFILMQK